MSTDHQFQPSDEFIPLLNDIPAGKNLNDRIKIYLAIGLFTGKKVSLSRAAHLAETTLTNFMEILTDHGIPCVNYTQDDFDMDMKTLKKLQHRDEENDEDR